MTILPIAPKIVVLGSGAWGTALALSLSRNGRPVTIWAHSPEIAKEITDAGENLQFLPGFKLPPEITVSGDNAAVSPADIIVSVGRGIKEKENISLVEDLAKALGGELAASRPICDSGWLPMERQVGSSGQTVAPKLYIAIGISGAIQHLVGMQGSQCIVAINKDPEAPIFEVADYGIVGDLFEVVPALTEALKSAK